MSRPYRPSPRPTSRRPGADLVREGDPARLGRRRGGRGGRLDLRLDRQDPLPRVRAAGQRRVPSLARVPDGVRRRRVAVRARGDDGDRQPRDGRGGAHPDRRQRLLPQGHVAPRVRVRRQAAEGGRVLLAAAVTGLLGRLRAHAAVPGGESRYADDALLGNLVPGAPRRRTLHAVREGDLVWRRDLGALVGILACSPSTSPGTRSRWTRGRSPAEHRHGGDEVLFVLRGELWVRAWHDGETFVFEALRPTTRVAARRLRARVPQRTAPSRPGDCSASWPRYLP